jgi:hypothetical protein
MGARQTFIFHAARRTSSSPENSTLNGSDVPSERTRVLRNPSPFFAANPVQGDSRVSPPRISYYRSLSAAISTVKLDGMGRYAGGLHVGLVSALAPFELIASKQADRNSA